MTAVRLQDGGASVSSNMVGLLLSQVTSEAEEMNPSFPTVQWREQQLIHKLAE